DAAFRPVREVDHDFLGQDHVRLQQFHRGVPVTGAELIVHLKGSRVVAANGKTLAETEGLDVAPALAPEAAAALVRETLQRSQHRALTLSAPHLELLDTRLLGGPPRPRSLVWFVEAGGAELREYFWVDARHRLVVLHFSQRPEAKKRLV